MVVTKGAPTAQRVSKLVARVAPHTAPALAVLLRPCAADARVLARVMMPAESLATPQRRCYCILTTPMHLTPLTEARHTFALTFRLLSDSQRGGGVSPIRDVFNREAAL